MTDFPLAIDQALNTLIYIEGDGWGMADEAISARVWRCWTMGLISDRWYRAIDDAFFWQPPHHCFRAWRAEVERRQLPGHYSLAT
jgi:hypothetical protein